MTDKKNAAGGIFVSAKAVRELVREMFDNKDIGSVLIPETSDVVKVNDVVDQSAFLTDDDHPNHKPQNKAELAVAVNTMLGDLPDDQAAGVYDKLKGAVDIASAEYKEHPKEKEMREKDKVEEAIRLAIRKMLDEAWVKGPSGAEIWTDETPKKGKSKPLAAPTGELPPVKKIAPGVRGGEAQAWIDKGKKDLKNTFKLMKDDPADVDDEPVSDEPKRTYKSTAIGGMSDVAGASFQDIATSLGFSVAGAKQAVDKALLKAQWLSKLEQEAPEELEIMTLTAMNDYIKFLSKSGALSAADVQLMKDHPDIVRELDGFREFLDKAIRKSRKVDQPGVASATVNDEDDTLIPPTATAPSAQSPAAKAAETPAAAATKAGKDTYKIYKGGQKYGGAAAVTRYKGKVYASADTSEFRPGESGVVSPEDGKLKVKKTSGDHTQTWEPFGEAVEKKNPKGPRRA